MSEPRHEAVRRLAHRMRREMRAAVLKHRLSEADALDVLDQVGERWESEMRDGTLRARLEDGAGWNARDREQRRGQQQQR